MPFRRTPILALGLALAACHRTPLPSDPPSGATADSGATTGTLVVRVTDALDGTPIPACSVVGWESPTSMTEVTPSGDDVAADGVHRFVVPPDLRRVRIAAEGHSETWCGGAGVRAGGVKRLAVAMLPSSHLVARVVESDGTPVPKGTLLLTGRGRMETIGVDAGVVDQHVDAGTVDVEVDPQFMPAYLPQRKRVTLAPGRRTDLTLELRRRD